MLRCSVGFHLSDGNCCRVSSGVKIKPSTGNGHCVATSAATVVSDASTQGLRTSPGTAARSTSFRSRWRRSTREGDGRGSASTISNARIRRAPLLRVQSSASRTKLLASGGAPVARCINCGRSADGSTKNSPLSPAPLARQWSCTMMQRRPSAFGPTAYGAAARVAALRSVNCCGKQPFINALPRSASKRPPPPTPFDEMSQRMRRPSSSCPCIAHGDAFCAITFSSAPRPTESETFGPAAATAPAALSRLFFSRITAMRASSAASSSADLVGLSSRNVHIPF